VKKKKKTSGGEGVKAIIKHGESGEEEIIHQKMKRRPLSEKTKNKQQSLVGRRSVKSGNYDVYDVYTDEKPGKAYGENAGK